MYTKRQLEQAYAAVSLLGLKEADFELLTTAEEIRHTHKETNFYFIISPDSHATASILNTIPVYSDLFVIYIPDIDKVVINKNNHITHPVESWEEAMGYLRSWLRWIRKEFHEQTEREQVELEQDREMAELVALSPGLPFITAQIPNPLSHLHPAVQQAIGARFTDGYYSDALHKACTALEKAVQDKAQQSTEPTGATLMSKVFSKDKPLLTLSSNQGEQEGYMFLYRGLAQAIRNHYAHNDPATDPARALEWLSFLSALFYKLDEAQPTVVMSAP